MRQKMLELMFLLFLHLSVTHAADWCWSVVAAVAIRPAAAHVLSCGIYASLLGIQLLAVDSCFDLIQSGQAANAQIAFC